MNKKLFGRVALIVVVIAATGAAITSTIGSASPSADHWVDNLRSGTTASNFDGNSSSDCDSAAFQSADYDLWSFVVNQASDASTILSWNATNSVWANPASVNVEDVTADYGPYTSGDGTKHLWVATTPPGATLVRAYLNFDGTAGRENLSHACGRSEPVEGIRLDANVEYDMTWDWQIDKTVDWRPNPAGGYTLDYAVRGDRSAATRLVPGSLHVSNGVVAIPSTLALTGLAVTFTQGAYVEPCDVNLAALQYDCEVDTSRVSKDSGSGRPTGTATLSAVASHAGGTLTDSIEIDLSEIDPTHVHASTASLSDDNATPVDESDDASTEEDELDYSVGWTPSGAACVERTNTATLNVADPAPETDDPTDSVTVRWCSPMAARGIGYWGNKTGAKAVVGRIANLKSIYPNALTGVPVFASVAQVHIFMMEASCDGSCQSMFAAQFLAASMNAVNPAFAAQSVEFGGDCVSVMNLLAEANTGAVSGAKTFYEAYKSIFDDINNARQTPCLTVID